jgi:hypothetical protein
MLHEVAEALDAEGWAGAGPCRAFRDRPYTDIHQREVADFRIVVGAGACAKPLPAACLPRPGARP